MREPRRRDARTSRARALRQNTTPAERRLWRALRLVEVPEGHFRRQAPIGPYFADFAHHSLRLVVELDGEQHGQSLGLRRDARRTVYLNEQGYRVLRFWNHEVAENLDGVVETIFAAVAERTQRADGNIRAALAQGTDACVPLPPRSGGEGTGGGRI
ncbi:MAG: endonuclease domain-containing protein [Hyphomicrobiales bacterium]|nr:endonuclease domain-containing protein [Hyphomicrobiales bacterium]